MVWLSPPCCLQGVKLLSYLYQEALDNCSNEHYPVLLSLLKTSCEPYTRWGGAGEMLGRGSQSPGGGGGGGRAGSGRVGLDCSPPHSQGGVTPSSPLLSTRIQVHP